MVFNKYLGPYYRKYWMFYAIGFIALIFVDYIQLYLPEYLGEIIGIVRNGGSDIGPLLGKMLLVGLGILVGRMSWRLSIFYAARKMESQVRADMFRKAEKLSQTYFHINNVGTLMDWFTNDLDEVEEYLGWGFVMMIDAVFLSIFVVYKIINLDIIVLKSGILTGLTAIPIILIIIWGLFVERIMAKMWDIRQKEFDRLYDFTRESFTGIRVIKAFVKERKEIKAFYKEAKRNKDANIRHVKVSVIFDVIIEFIIAIMIILIMVVGAYMVSKGVYQAEQLVTYIGYVDSVIWPMIALGQIIAMRSRAKASLKRITNYLDSEVDINDKEDAIELDNCQGKIEFNHLTFAFPDDPRPVLNDVTLTINAGENIGIVGKIGCGKTTLANLLLHLYNVDDNQILIDGHDLMNIKIKSLRENVGYAMQDNFLFSDTIQNNIAFADKTLSNEVVRKAAMFADVDSNIIAFKDGYNTVSGERGVTLSGGQKQRIGIARAYIKNSPILILDDSVAAVDLKTEETILDNIFKYRKDKTTILIASRVSTVINMDKILVLKDGCVEAFDTPANLEKNSETFKKMVYLQKLEQEVEGGAI